MKYNWLLLIFFAFSITACDKPVVIDVPRQTPKLCIQAMWDQNNALEVLVTRSFSINETPRFDYANSSPWIANKLKMYSVKNAKVEVLKDDVLYEALVFDTAKQIYTSATGKTAEPGASYTIRASAPGFVNVSAPELKHPDPVMIKSIQVRRGVTSSSSTGGAQDEITIEFDDPVDTKNFYWVTISRKWVLASEPDSYSPIYVYPVDQDIVVPAGFDISTSLSSIDGNYIVLKDDSFNGHTKRLKIQLSSYELGNTVIPLVVSLNNVSAGLFYYLRSRVLIVDNPFSTPTQTYSNITNGFGVFGLYASDQREIQ